MGDRALRKRLVGRINKNKPQDYRSRCWSQELDRAECEC